MMQLGYLFSKMKRSNSQNSLLPLQKGDGGPAQLQVVMWIGAWYMFSMLTLFLNKIILQHPEGDEYVLGITQMASTAIYGGLKVYGPNMIRRAKSTGFDNDGSMTGLRFYQNMVLVGVMRGATVILGLISLSHVAVSFTETIKASAPFFTVVFARVMLGEQTSWPVNLSLIPVVVGLLLCTFTELSFDMMGFVAAIANNLVDCIQNVFSKKLLTGGLSPIQLQFYTSVAAAVIQLPILLYKMRPHLASGVPVMSQNMMLMLFVDGIFYHLQSVTAYCTMNLISPVSASVANTAKRALLIVLSILYFENRVTSGNLLGVTVVVGGVFLYNHCRAKYPSVTRS
eukprot:m.28364 g.28364  ORF g.28364 m.28364 type:complete len:341 (+) comp7997_c0_seq1:172-1194(+)